MDTQNKDLLWYMITHPAGITQAEAFTELGIGRLSARIYDLRHKHNYPIETIKKPVRTRRGTKTVAQYKFPNDYTLDMDKVHKL